MARQKTEQRHETAETFVPDVGDHVVQGVQEGGVVVWGCCKDEVTRIGHRDAHMEAWTWTEEEG